MTLELDEKVSARLRQLSERSGVSYEELVTQLEEILNDDFVRSDPQFKTEQERLNYALRVLWVRISAQPPTKEYKLIAYGKTDVRATRNGIPQAKMYALVEEGGRLVNRVVLFRGNNAQKIDDVVVTPPHAYKMHLSEVNGLLFAANKTVIGDGRPIPGDPKDFFVRKVGVVPVKLKDAGRRLSEVDENGFVNELDLRGIQGIVIRYNVGTREDGTQWGVYTISDDSLVEDLVSEDYIVPTQFTVWTPASLVKYDVDSECFFVGTLVKNRDSKVVFMNAINVIPVHARLIGEV